MNTLRAQFSGRGHPGFTLLELLVATAISAIVLLVIQTAFSGALRLHSTTHALLDGDRELHRAFEIIRRDLAGLTLPRGVLTGRLQTATMDLAADSLGQPISPGLYTSSATIDGWSSFSEVQRVTYYLAPDTAHGDNALVRAATRNLLPVVDEPDEPQVVLRGVADAAMDFYDGRLWIDTWDSEASSMLPAAIRFRLTLTANETGATAGEPLELIVPIAVRTFESAREDSMSDAP